MVITSEMVKELRAETQVQLMTCKKALEESDGDFPKARKLLREWGIEAGENRADRQTGSGVVVAYQHHNNKIVAVVELRCETEPVAKTDEFIQLANTIASHVAWANPNYLDRSGIPLSDKQDEAGFHLNGLSDKQKSLPDQIQNKIIDGKMEKFFTEKCLVDQIEANSKESIGSLVKALSGKLGENIEICEIGRFEV